MPSLQLSEEDFLALVAEDVMACRMRSHGRPDITPLLENPVAWRTALDRVLEETHTQIHLIEQRRTGETDLLRTLNRAKSYLYKCHLRIEECDRILYLRNVGPETSIARLMCDKIAEHKTAKNGTGDSYDELLWTALEGVVART